MKATALDHVVLEVHDVERALAFWSGVLGLEPVRLEEFRRGEAPFLSVRAGACLVDLFPSDAPGPGPNHLCIEVDASPQEMVRELEQAGYSGLVPAPRFGSRGNGLSVYVRDPDGHQVEVRTYQADC